MIIIEKKPTLPSVKDIKVPYNYVLVKMDDSYETFQFKGQETQIMASPIVYDQGKEIRVDEKLVNPFGTVMKTPDRLAYHGREMKYITDTYQPVRKGKELNEYGEPIKYIANRSAMRELTELKKTSLSYDTDMELCEGDRVHVSYIHFLNAEKEGLFIETQEGNLVFIKYDLFRMTVDENNQPKKMLNGYVLIKPKVYDVNIEKDNGVEFTKTDSGLVLLNPKTTKRTRKNQIGTVILCGTPLRGYIEMPNQVDPKVMYSVGEQLLYDPRYATKLENDLHQIISKEDLYLIRREGILLSEGTFFGDFSKIEI